jgi:hypothetical protein
VADEIKVFLLKEETVEELMELTGLSREWFDAAIDWDESFGIEKMYVVPFKSSEPWAKAVVAEVIYSIDKNIDEVVIWTEYSEEQIAQFLQDHPGLGRHYMLMDVTLDASV